MLLESGFKKTIMLFTTLAVTMERFYFWPEKPGIDLKGFQSYLSLITPGSFVGNALVTRLLTNVTRPVYEKTNNKTLIDWTTKQPSPPNLIYRVPELVANPLSEPNIGFDMSRAWSTIIPTASMAKCIQEDSVLYSKPALASTNPVSKHMPQYMFTAMKFAYRGGRPPPNATAAERFASCAGGFSVHFDIWNIVETVSRDLKESKQLIVKLVDVTDTSIPPLAMYVPMMEMNASRGNWTFRDYSYKTKPKIGSGSRQYELWCKLAPGVRFFPVRAVAYSAALLLLGLGIAQLWWVHMRTLSVSEKQCRDAIRLKDEMALAKLASDEHSAAKSAFVASVSHEIRTPMNGVLGMLGLLVDTTNLSPVQDDYARTALSSGKALLSLVNDILDLSKIESGCMELESIPFNPAEEMDSILSMFGERSRGKNLELAALAHEGLPNLVMGDPGRFRQVIINLVGNSLKFVNRGHIFVRIMAVPDNELTASLLKTFHSGDFSDQIFPGAEEAESSGTPAVHRTQTLSGYEVVDGDCCWPSVEKCSAQQWQLSNMFSKNSASKSMRLLVWVEDSGIGIPDAAKERIFKPFMQADTTTSRKYGGTGIGLNISKKLVELMSGQLDFTSAVNRGTTFRLDMRASLPQKSLGGGLSAQGSQRPSVRASFASCCSPSSGNLQSFLSPMIGSPSTAKTTAYCIDNNALRAHITVRYLQRAGVTAYPIVVQYPALVAAARPRSRFGPREVPECITRVITNSSFEGMPELPPANVAFLEMDPSQGCWPTEQHGTVRPPGAVSPSVSGGVARPTPESAHPGSSTLHARKDATLSDFQQRFAWAQGLATQIGGSAEAGKVDVGLPVVLISNVQELELESIAKEAGFARVIVKPLRRATFSACLQGLVGRDGTSSKLSTVKDESRPSSDGTISELTEALSGTKILVVDDNIVNRKVASKVLEKYGITVTCRTNGEEAVAAVMGEHQFDAVLTDIQMPLMDGLEATRAIRKAEAEGLSKGPYLSLNRTGVPIFALTADVMKGSLEKCAESGMNGIVPKPIEEMRLLQLVQEHLQPYVEEEIDGGELSEISLGELLC